ncbi:uncharacterized protein LOC121519130 isoform X2 [Cheilinus undulatus]|uniref:uncharacterized protein LOC121519130 isoform X2 n=1 Tax=Cheilinus undulatus TaxID=241271 RepID=UPI001BD6D1F6|nr:uncharacterized protein LOC121519130 isoform X2 [Cheilinus undulatus]
MGDCFHELVGLVLLLLALLISLCLNVFFCIRHRATLCKDKDECCYPNIYEPESLSHSEGQYFHNINHHEQQENSGNHQEQQENPIYGNIINDRRGSQEVCYEMMTMQHTRDRTQQTLEADLNYASLDLKLAKKHKKRPRHKHQARHSLQDQLTVHPVNAFLEVEADMEAHLPSRDTSTMVSHSSIYLNSQQIAQEAEEMERERGGEVWEGIRGEEDRLNTVWKGGGEGEERMNFSNGDVCAVLSEAEQSCTNHLVSTFNHDDGLED